MALPIAYFIATRGGRRKSLLIVLLIVPFWTSFLIRTYAWLTILGPEGLAGFIGHLIGDSSFRILGTPWAVLLGVVYGYLPLMVFPIYVTMERMDRTLIEASKDLGAARLATFRQITLPITATGLITGSILVFIPLMGEYVIPAILGLRPGLPDRQPAGPPVPRLPELAAGLGKSSRPDRHHARVDRLLPVVRQSGPKDT